MVTIDAPADRVWDVLLDGDAYPTWDSGVAPVEGPIVDGGKVKVHSDVAPGRAFPVKVAIDRAAGTMTWSGGMPLGLFRGVRTFRVRPADSGVAMSMREEFSGPMLGMIWKRMPDLQPSFDQSTSALKARAEGG
ncbi:MAG: SRPBCC family protein [Acidimicrobiales bacterium]